MAERAVKVRIDADISGYTRGLFGATAETKAFSRELQSSDRFMSEFARDADSTGKEIDRLSGRMRLLADTAAIMGPGLIPFGAAAIPAVTGLANEFGVATLAAGTAMLAFHGVGGALKALNDEQMDPTAAHLQALNQSMAAIGPEGRDLVTTLNDLRPALGELQGLAQKGMFPGLTVAIGDLERRLPDVEALVTTLAGAMGKLSEEAGAALGGPEWDSFFAMLESEAGPTLMGLGKSIGNVSAGLADLWVAFAPLNHDFSTGMVEMARAFHGWADGLSQTQGFRDFLAYVDSTAPKVLGLLGSVGRMFVAVATAAAPLGGPVLDGLTALSNVITAIAKSDLGTPIFAGVAALAIYNRALQATTALQASAFATKALPRVRAVIAPLTADVATLGTTWMTAGAKTEREAARMSAAAGRLGTAMKGALAVGGIIIGLDLLSQALDSLFHKSLDESNLGRSLQALSHGTVAGELQQTFGSNLMGFTKNIEELTDATGKYDEVVSHIPLIGNYLGGKPFTEASDNIKTLDSALSSLVEGGQEKQADAVFARLATAADKAGVSTKQLAKLFPQYTLAVHNANAADGTAATAAGRVAEANHAEAVAINASITAMRNKRSATLAAGNAEIAYQQALDDARASLKQNGRTLNINTDAGRANKTALYNIASAWNSLTDRQQNAKGAFASARRSLVDQAMQFGATRAQARHYADTLLDIPKKAATAVHLLGAGAAISEVEALQARIDALHSKDVTVRVNEIHSQSFGPGAKAMVPTHAAGGPVFGPGTSTSDSIPAWLSDGEFVVQAAAVDKYGLSYMEQLNAMGLASGGYASRDLDLELATGGMASQDAYALAAGGSTKMLYGTKGAAA